MAEQVSTSLDSLGLTRIGGHGSSGAVNRVAVVGGGAMGQGLAQAVSQTGIEVILVERNERTLEAAIEGLSRSLDKEIDKWGLTSSEKRAVLARVIGTTDLGQTARAPFVIEAIQEKAGDKATLLRDLDAICAEQAVLATNATSLSVTCIAEGVTRRERVIGTHFLDPAPRVPLVEVVRGRHTSDATFVKAKNFIEKQLKKTVVEVADKPGGITTRVLLALLIEGFRCLTDEVASPEQIDTAVRLGWGFPVGPLEFADQMGLDRVLVWMENLSREPGGERFQPCPILVDLVNKGHCGKKAGRGFFEYDPEGRRLVAS